MVQNAKYALWCVVAGILFTGCVAADDDESTYSAPEQPGEVSLDDGKADRLSKSIRREDTSETLRAKSLRQLACQTVPTDVAVRSLAEDCVNQEFEVTAFYTDTDLVYKGKDMLVAMDVKVSTKEEAVYAVRLIRYFKPSSLVTSWTGSFTEQLVEPNAVISEFEALIKEGGAWPDDAYSDNFVEIPFDTLPALVVDIAAESVANLEADLEGDYMDDYYVENAYTYEIMSDNGERLGWAVSYSLSYGNGDGGVTFYFGADGYYIDEYRYYA